MPLLRVDNLRHGFADHTVFSDVSFELDPGTALAIVGPNGSGKSTLLRCVVGADKPVGGAALLDGAAFDDTDPDVRRAVATVFDDIDFFPDLTVAEHLDLLARGHAESGDTAGTEHIQHTVDDVLRDIGLADASAQFPGTLSSGQRHRLALATAFVRPRRLLILDEPEQRLDSAGRAWLACRLQQEKENAVAILFASHSPDLIDVVADDVRTMGVPA